MVLNRFVVVALVAALGGGCGKSLFDNGTGGDDTPGSDGGVDSSIDAPPVQTSCEAPCLGDASRKLRWNSGWSERALALSRRHARSPMDRDDRHDDEGRCWHEQDREVRRREHRRLRSAQRRAAVHLHRRHEYRRSRDRAHARRREGHATFAPRSRADGRRRSGHPPVSRLAGGRPVQRNRDGRDDARSLDRHRCARR